MRVVFMGSPEFAVPTLRALATSGVHEVALVVSQPDKPAGRGAQLTAPAVKVAAQALGLPVIQPASAKTGELARALADSGAELAVVVAYGKILPRAVLDALPRGCLNVHGSLLPKYRGAAPVQWAVDRWRAAHGRVDHAARRGHGHRAGAARARGRDRSAKRRRESCSRGSLRSARRR